MSELEISNELNKILLQEREIKLLREDLLSARNKMSIFFKKLTEKERHKDYEKLKEFEVEVSYNKTIRKLNKKLRAISQLKLELGYDQGNSSQTLMNENVIHETYNPNSL